MIPPYSNICIISRFSMKLIVFLKMFQVSLTAKKVDYIFKKQLNSQNCWLAVFSLPLSIPGENRIKLKKIFNLNSRLIHGEHNTADTQNATNISLSATAAIQLNFWIENNLCFVSDCKNSFICKLKKLLNDKIIIFYSPSNTLCSSDESVQKKKHILSIIISLVCAPFLLGSICKYWMVVKVGLSPFKKGFFICFNDSPSKMMKNTLFHLKSSFRSQDI